MRDLRPTTRTQSVPKRGSTSCYRDSAVSHAINQSQEAGSPLADPGHYSSATLEKLARRDCRSGAEATGGLRRLGMVDQELLDDGRHHQTSPTDLNCLKVAVSDQLVELAT